METLFTIVNSNTRNKHKKTKWFENILKGILFVECDLKENKEFELNLNLFIIDSVQLLITWYKVRVQSILIKESSTKNTNRRHNEQG